MFVDKGRGRNQTYLDYQYVSLLLQLHWITHRWDEFFFVRRNLIYLWCFISLQVHTLRTKLSLTTSISHLHWNVKSQPIEQHWRNSENFQSQLYCLLLQHISGHYHMPHQLNSTSNVHGFIVYSTFGRPFSLSEWEFTLEWFWPRQFAHMLVSVHIQKILMLNVDMDRQKKLPKNIWKMLRHSNMILKPLKLWTFLESKNAWHSEKPWNTGTNVFNIGWLSTSTRDSLTSNTELWQRWQSLLIGMEFIQANSHIISLFLVINNLLTIDNYFRLLFLYPWSNLLFATGRSLSQTHRLRETYRSKKNGNICNNLDPQILCIQLHGHSLSTEGCSSNLAFLQFSVSQRLYFLDCSLCSLLFPMETEEKFTEAGRKKRKNWRYQNWINATLKLNRVREFDAAIFDKFFTKVMHIDECSHKFVWIEAFDFFD